MVQSVADVILDGAHIASPADLDIDDVRRYRVGRCLLTTVYLEDIGLVGCVLKNGSFAPANLISGKFRADS